MTDTPTEEIAVLESLIALLKIGAVDGPVLMRAITFGGLRKMLREHQAKAGPDAAAMLATAAAKAEAVDLGPAPMETNVRMLERKILNRAHSYAMAKAGCLPDADGNMVSYSQSDLDVHAEVMINQLTFAAERLTAAAHVDGRAAS